MGDSGGPCPSLGSKLSQSPVQGVHRPVAVIPAKEPAHKRRRLKALLHQSDGSPSVPISWVGLDVSLSYRHTWGKGNAKVLRASHSRETVVQGRGCQ